MNPNLPPDSPADVVGILDEMSDLVATRKGPGPTCGVTVALTRIGAADAAVADEVRKRIDDDAYPASGLASVLTSRTGVSVSSFTLRRHRKRGTVDGCRCPR